MLDDIRELVEYPLQHPEVKSIQMGGSHGFLKDAIMRTCSTASMMIGCMQL